MSPLSKLSASSPASVVHPVSMLSVAPVQEFVSSAERRIIPLLFLAVAVLLLRYALTSAPTQDEPAHLTAALMTVENPSRSFYEVNPPISKLITGSAVMAFRDPELPDPISHAHEFAGSRVEFIQATRYLQHNPDGYRWDTVIGRLPRVGLLIAALVVLLLWISACLRDAATVLSTLLVASPIVIGHGWTLMPDGLSLSAMCFLIVASLSWLRQPTTDRLVTGGVAWGVALATKFTYCPLYVLWPIAILGYLVAGGRATGKRVLKKLIGHALQGVIALLVVWTAYNFSQIGHTFGQHYFQSERMQSLLGNSWLMDVPSPFPRMFLIGIDEQQLDLERGYDTYVNGHWYREGLWWYYVFGIAAKESLVGLLMMAVMPIGAVLLWARARKSPQDSAEPFATLVFCLSVAASVLLVLSLHPRMALNVRYAAPAIPPLYVAISLAGGELLRRCFDKRLTPDAIDQRGFAGRITTFVLVGLAAAETAWVYPHHFSYINPLFGGMDRRPLALHDSNFDGGQDLWRLEDTLHDPRWNDRTLFLYLHTKVPKEGFESKVAYRIPENGWLRRFVAHRESRGEIPWNDPQATLIVSRIFEAPMGWTQLFGQTPVVDAPLRRLLRNERPDEIITPAIWVYHSKHGP